MCVYTVIKPGDQVVSGQGFTCVGLSVSPEGGTFKLGVNESKTFTATATNGSVPFDYSWTVAASGNFTIQLNGENHDVTDASSIIVSGQELTLCYPVATEEYVSVQAQVTDANGYTGSILQPFIVADPYTSSGYKFDASTATASYIIQADGKGWYRAIEGATGAVKFPSISADFVVDSVINSIPVVGTVQFQNGLYPDVSILISDKFIQLIGETRAGVVLRGQGSGTVTIQIANTALLPTTGSQGFQRLTVDNADGTGIGVYLNNVTYCDFRDFTIRNCGEGLRLSGCLVNTFSGYFIGHNTIGISLIGDNPWGTNANLFSGGEIGANTLHNVDIEGAGYEASGNVFDGTTMEGTQAVMIQINSDGSSPSNNKFINGWYESHSTDTPTIFNEAKSQGDYPNNQVIENNRIVCANGNFYAYVNNGDGAIFNYNIIYPYSAGVGMIILNGDRNTCWANHLIEPAGSMTLYIGNVGTDNNILGNIPNN